MLNARRVREQRAQYEKRGRELDRTDGDLPYVYFDAICETEEEAGELEFDINAMRRYCKMLQAAGR